MKPLRGAITVITGGSRGIGLAIAKLFATYGASTILVARDTARLRHAVATVRTCYQPPPPPSADDPKGAGHVDDLPPFYTGIAGDVSQAALWEDLADKLRRGSLGHQVQCRDPRTGNMSTRSEKVDVLVNCAGIAQNSLLQRTSPDDIARILDTNLRSAVLGCKYVLPFMHSSRNASIINVSSAMASMGGRGAAVYAASKAGLLGLTSSMAVELARKRIRVNALLPGYIQSDMTESLDAEKLSGAIPLGWFGDPGDVAHAALFLAENCYANNCHLTIDGGLSAGGF